MFGIPDINKEHLFKGINMALDSIYGLGCKFTGCLEPEPMYLAKMWHLMKAHRKRTKITKIIPTWPSPQLAPPAPAPAAGAAAAPNNNNYNMPSFALGPSTKGARGSGKNFDTDDLGDLMHGGVEHSFDMEA